MAYSLPLFCKWKLWVMPRDIFVHVKNTSIYSQQGYDNILLSSLLIKIQQFVKLI